MKIVAIEPFSGKTVVLNGLTLKPVRLKTKSWFDEKIFMAYPISIGPTFGGSDILYVYWVDHMGKRLDNNISEQLTNYFRTL